eukprot:676474-Prorocentrum_minimum.AAC.3
MDNPHPNPASDWLSDKGWGEICRLDAIKGFDGLREAVKWTPTLYQVGLRTAVKPLIISPLPTEEFNSFLDARSLPGSARHGHCRIDR